MRILHLMPMDRIRSGGPMQLKRLVLELASRGHQVIVVFGDSPEHRPDFAELIASSVDVRFIKFDGFKLNRTSLASVVELRRLLKQLDVDVIHAHKGTMLDLLVLARIGLTLPPVIANRGMSAPLKWRNSSKYRASWLTKIIAVAEDVKQVMIKTGDVNPDKILVIYGSVDTETYHPGIKSTLRQELGIEESTPVVGYLGSLTARKGFSYMLEAFRLVRKQNPAAVLVGVGFDDTDLAYRNHHISTEIDSYFYRVPFRSDVANCMAAFDVLAFSGIKNEGLTGALREAAAMELAIVSTDVGGNRELIQHQKTGLLVPIKDANALAAGIVHLLDKPDFGRQYGRAAREWVLTHMTNHKRADQIEALYWQAIDQTAL